MSGCLMCLFVCLMWLFDVSVRMVSFWHLAVDYDCEVYRCSLSSLDLAKCRKAINKWMKNKDICLYLIHCIIITVTIMNKARMMMIIIIRREPLSVGPHFFLG